MSMAVQFTGKYVRTEEENYEAFLSKMGLNYMMRKAAMASTPSMEIYESSPGKWRLVNITKFKTVELNFEFDKPVEEKTADGRECVTTVRRTNDRTWVTNQVAKKKGEKSVEVIREFVDDGIKVQMICDNVVSKQFFKRK